MKRETVIVIHWADDVTRDDVLRLSRAWAAKISGKESVVESARLIVRNDVTDLAPPVTRCRLMVPQQPPIEQRMITHEVRYLSTDGTRYSSHFNTSTARYRRTDSVKTKKHFCTQCGRALQGEWWNRVDGTIYAICSTCEPVGVCEILVNPDIYEMLTRCDGLS